MINRKLTMIWAALVFSSAAWAGGELPFPFDVNEQSPVLQSVRWTVAETNLIVDLKVYVDTKAGGTQWIKIWLRDKNHFVYSRIRQQKTGDALLEPVEVGDQKGQLAIDLASRGRDFLILNGLKFTLTRQQPSPPSSLP